MTFLTGRDVEILRFINEFGFCELRQIIKKFSLQPSNGYKIMRRLCKGRYAILNRIFLRKPGVYLLTKKGECYSDLACIEKIPLPHYEHQLRVIEVCTKLTTRYPDAHFVSERRLLKNRDQIGIGKKKHIPDAMLIFPDGKQVAIEIELSQKAMHRLDTIFKAYAGQFAIEEVWYYCMPSLVPLLNRIAEKRSFIKIHNLTEFLHDEGKRL